MKLSLTSLLPAEPTKAENSASLETDRTDITQAFVTVIKGVDPFGR
jgi:hypothetical protein